MSDEDAALLQASPIRVLLATLPELLARVIEQTIAGQADMQVIGYARHNWELLQMAGSDIDVIVMGAPVIYPPPGICDHLFAKLPTVKILVIDPAGTTAMRYWMALRRSRTSLDTNRRLIVNIRRLANIDSTT